MVDAENTRSKAFQDAFEMMHSQGVAFPSLVLDMLKHHNHSVASVSTSATIKLGALVSEHQVRGTLHGRVAPTSQIRKSIQEAIGFDPWSVVHHPNLPGAQKALDGMATTIDLQSLDDDSEQ